MGYPKWSFNEILSISPILREIVCKVEQLAKLNRQVLNKLEPQLAKHCRVANLKDGILILTTQSPTWGHQLRFASSDLLSALRAEPEWCGLKSIKIHVRPNEIPTLDRVGSTILSGPMLSPLGASYLQKTAETITDVRLQEALSKLSQRITMKATR